MTKHHQFVILNLGYAYSVLPNFEEHASDTSTQADGQNDPEVVGHGDQHE